MHALEKILAAHAGKEKVEKGEIVDCLVDVAGINDIYLQTVYSFREIGGTKVANPDGVVIFLDHYSPPSTVRQAQIHREFRDFSYEHGIKHLMDINQGVCHQILADKGFSAPGRLMVVTDSHTTSHGAYGAFSTGVGATDMAAILKTGKLWFRVPSIIKITIDGVLPKNIYAKDIILKILGDLKADFAVYKGIEFTGTTISNMSISERMTLCNMTTEIGAKATYIQPDEITFAALKEAGVKEDEYTIYHTDEGYQYEHELYYKAEEFKMNLAVPFSVDNVELIDGILGIPVNQAYLGSCTGGKLEDIKIAAEIIKGKKINPKTRMLIVPASQKVLLDGIANGWITDLVNAGATLVTPGCASCLGTHEGMIADGEVCVSSTNRNFPGRMGHKNGRIYLASPAVVAASALAGCIARPEDYINN